MKKIAESAIVAAGLSVAAVLALFAIDRLALKPPRPPKTVKVAPALAASPTLNLKSFVETHQSDPDPNVQDRVGAARIRLAYDTAKGAHWEQARLEFLHAEKEYKGTRKVSADFGGVPDQARYQAIVCLIPEGKKSEAEREFVQFMKERPLSPLCHACFQRLRKLNQGEPKPEWTALLQKDLAAQQATVVLETNSCGPKCIERVLRSLRPAEATPTYKQIAARCGTGAKGTTIDQMCKALRSYGLVGIPYLLDRRDFGRTPLPAIILREDHYLVLEKVSATLATVFDPFDGQVRSINLPLADSSDFSVAAILFKALQDPS